MDTKEIIKRVDELSQIYSMGMHHYINAAICSENEMLVRFFEQLAIERMLFVEDLQGEIRKTNGTECALSIEDTINNWQNACSFQRLEETFFITNDFGWIDQKAICFSHQLLKAELSEAASTLIENQLLKIKSGFIALDYLLASLDH